MCVHEIEKSRSGCLDGLAYLSTLFVKERLNRKALSAACQNIRKGLNVNAFAGIRAPPFKTNIGRHVACYVLCCGVYRLHTHALIRDMGSSYRTAGVPVVLLFFWVSSLVHGHLRNNERGDAGLDVIELATAYDVWEMY